MIIKINEIIQCGDTFLLKYKCPFCSTEDLCGYPILSCKNCGKSYSDFEIDLPERTRLISGTKRKSKISKSIVRSLFEMQERKCGYCSIEISGVMYNVEHIIPLAVGGSNKIHNLCISCQSCNMIAGRKFFASFYAKREYILTQRARKNI